MTWLSANLPGTGGSYKVEVEHFVVEEIPLYPCCGSGDHLYLWIEKTGITTNNLLQQLASGLKLKGHEIGYAGLKDAKALTRQMISIPANREAQLATLQLQQAQILSSARHSNKLRTGHLAGNRFSICISAPGPQALKRAEAILELLERQGVPNLFGEQRYGVLGNSAILGQLLARKEYQAFCLELLGDPALINNADWKAAAQAYRAEDIPGALNALPKRMRDERKLLKQLQAGKSHQQAAMSLPRNLLRLFLSALQSQLFNSILRQRLNSLSTLSNGDIAIKHANGACFRVENAETEQQRADLFEISPTAPLFGHKVMLATGTPGELEQTALEQSGLTLNSLKLGQGLTMPGERRALRVPLSGARAQSHSNGDLQLEFSLPKGSYATSVLAEVIKDPAKSPGPQS
jgi:tRNA pseudouridine13 synthase